MDGRIGSDFSNYLPGIIGLVPGLLVWLGIPGILGNPNVSGQ